MSEEKCVSGWIPLGLALYLLVCGVLAIYFVADVWSEQFLFLRALFRGVDFRQTDLGTVKTVAYTTAGSLIGAVIISLKGLHTHYVVKQEFRMPYCGSYFIGPWAAGLLGIAVYVLIRGGLLVLGGKADLEAPTEATQFGYLGMGFLVGFAWDKVLVKLNLVAVQLFGSESVKPGAVAGGSQPSPVIKDAPAEESLRQANLEESRGQAERQIRAVKE
ncbi:MAG: hypothetical protein WCF57_22640 [Pyrinomonadaceae bacterium]